MQLKCYLLPLRCSWSCQPQPPLLMPPGLQLSSVCVICFIVCSDTWYGIIADRWQPFIPSCNVEAAARPKCSTAHFCIVVAPNGEWHTMTVLIKYQQKGERHSPWSKSSSVSVTDEIARLEMPRGIMPPKQGKGLEVQPRAAELPKPGSMILIQEHWTGLAAVAVFCHASFLLLIEASSNLDGRGLGI